MDTASQVLLIIVSAVLAIFLTALIIAVVYLIKVLRQVRRVTTHAENVAQSVESAANIFEKSASPLAMLKLISSIVNQATKFKTKKGKQNGKK